MADTPGERDPAWWWKAAATVLLGMLATILLKGCDEWQKTNDSLNQLQADVKYQIERVGQRELRLQQVEKNLTAFIRPDAEDVRGTARGRRADHRSGRRAARPARALSPEN